MSAISNGWKAGVGKVVSLQLAPIVDPSTQVSARAARRCDQRRRKSVFLGPRNLQSGRVNYIDESFLLPLLWRWSTLTKVVSQTHKAPAGKESQVLRTSQGILRRRVSELYQKTDTRGRCTVAVLGTAPDPLAGVPCPRSYGTERDRNMTEIQSFRGFQSHRERNSERVILTILSLLYN